MSVTVSEIFGPTVQGEGDLIGTPTVFVRTGGCDFRCSWCDTMYAVDPAHRDEWYEMEPRAIIDKVDELAGAPIMVTLSGGNPALRNDLGTVIVLGHERGHTFTMETQGSVVKPWFALLDHLTVSPKPPSSGMPTLWGPLDHCVAFKDAGPRVSLKVVVFDDTDFDYALEIHRRYPDVPFFASVGNPDVGVDETTDTIELLRRYQWLVDKINERKAYGIRPTPQLHVLLWGNARAV